MDDVGACSLVNDWKNLTEISRQECRNSSHKKIRLPDVLKGAVECFQNGAVENCSFVDDDGFGVS